MTERSRFWAGDTSLGAPGDAGPYTDQNWRDIEKYNGLYHPDGGVLVNSGTIPDEGLTVTQQSVLAMGVAVSAGRASVEGGFYENTATNNLAIAANASGNPRIDSVILRVDYAAQTIRLAVLQGTPAASPVPPTLTRTAAVYEISIADVDVANGAVSIANAVIWNYRIVHNAANGLYHDNVENRSGVTLRTGDIVYWTSAGTGRAVTTSTTVGNALPAGVWRGLTPALGYGRVQYSGIGLVRVTGTVAWGSYILQSSTAKIGIGMAIAGSTNLSGEIPAVNVVGRALQAVAYGGNNGLVLADIKVLGSYATAPSNYQAVSQGNTTFTSATFIDALDGAGGSIACRVPGFGANAQQVLMMVLSLTLSHSSPSKIDFDFNINGVSYATDIGASDGLHRILPAAAAAIQSYTIHIPIFPNLASGWVFGSNNNTIQLRWKTGAATATVYNANVANQDYPLTLLALLTG